VSVLAGAIDWSRERRSRDHVAAMLVGFDSWYADGVVVREVNGGALGMGRLFTTPQQAHPDREIAADVVAVVDGRLDNVADLRSALDEAADISDSDLVVAGYRRWGTEIVGMLRGEFALLLWDARSARLVAARDAFGIRPLCYARAGRRLLTASDPEQILATGLVAPEPDDESVVGHLLWEFPDRERTFFRDIRRLPAGHIMVATADGPDIRDYRRPEILERADGWDGWADEFRHRFLTAVRARISSSQPFVAHLSGGVDSSTIVCAIDQMQRDAPAMSRGVVAAALYPGLGSNEEKYIRAVEAQIKLPVECWDGTAAAADELGDVPLWAPGARFPWTGGTRGDLDIAHRHGARVVVSGTGGDQLGLPVGVIEDAVATGRWTVAARLLLRRPAATARSSFRVGMRVAKALAPAWLRSAHDRVRRRREQRPPWIARAAWGNWRPPPATTTFPAGLRTHVQSAHWRELTSARHLVSMEWAQQHAIRNRAEVRFPFMDADLVSLSLSLPWNRWPPPWPFERLHRTALGDMLPPLVRQRRSKANAADALANRARVQLSKIDDLFNSRSWASTRYVEQQAAREALSAFRSDPDPSFGKTWPVWAIATLEAWLCRLSGYTARAHGRHESDG
jgi:asparagine synthase (glutamine-hydrolysing)